MPVFERMKDMGRRSLFSVSTFTRKAGRIVRRSSQVAAVVVTDGDAEDTESGLSSFWRWAYRNLNFGRYQPWDETIQRTDIEYYEPKLLVRLLDKFARRMDRAGEVTAGDLPPTYCGACCSFFLMIFVAIFAQMALGDLLSNQTNLSAWGDIVLNADYYCAGLNAQGNQRGSGINREYRASLSPLTTGAAARDEWDVPGCEWKGEYFSGFLTSAKPPYLDVPVLQMAWTQRIEFSEADGKSSLAKIKWVDKNGIHFGGTSLQSEVPVGFGAHEKTAITFNSYPFGASEFESPFPNMTRYIREMAVTSSTHNFDESLRYAYSDMGLLQRHNEFFDHDAVAFVRFDRKQLRNVKSCQLQFGLVNRYQYEALRPYLLKYTREYQKTEHMNTLTSNNFTWDPSVYTNSETGTHRRPTEMNNMMILQTGWNATDAKRFMQSFQLGKYQLNIERQMRVNLGFPTGYVPVSGGAAVNQTQQVEDLAAAQVPLLFSDWMLFASYVNNFQHSIESVTCDGKSGKFFNSAYLKANAPDKVASKLTLKTPVALWTKKFPFYVLVTGNMGSERMLVTGKGDTDYEVKVTRGNQIGANRLNHAVTPPSDYPAVSNPTLWVCPPNRYNDQQYCDCNCGMTDPDCLLGIYETVYCNSGEVCSPAGRCTLPVYNPATSEVAVSEPCERMNMPGDVILHGYFGHATEFRAANGNQCQVCPYDELYSGRTNRNEKNEYVCQYRPDGDIPASEVMALDPTTIQTYGSSGNATIASIIDRYRIVKASLGPKAGFPVKALNESNFTVELDQGMGIHELVTAIKSEKVNAEKKTQVLHIMANGLAFRYKHHATGQMASSMTGDYADMVMQLDDDTKPFSNTGPYRIQIDSSEIVIRTGSNVKAESSEDSSTSSSSSSSSAGSSRRQLLEIKRERLGLPPLDDSEPGFGTGEEDATLGLSSSWYSTLQAPAAAQVEQNLFQRRFLSSSDEDNSTNSSNATDEAVENLGLTTLSVSTVQSCARASPKRQRLDVNNYPVGLKSAGVRGILSRQYTANVPSEDVSLYRYFYPNQEMAAAATEPARNLYFADSSSNSIPGATNCFTDFYQTPYTTACRVTQKTYRMFLYLQTPPASTWNGASGQLDPNQAWTVNDGVQVGGTGGGTPQNIGLMQVNGVKEALAEGLANAFGMPNAAGVTSPDVAEVQLSTVPFTVGGNPNPALTYTEDLSKRAANLEIRFTLRKWYSLPNFVDAVLPPNSFPTMTFRTAISKALRQNTEIRNLLNGNEYDDVSSQHPKNPLVDDTEHFRVLEVAALEPVTRRQLRREERRRKLLYTPGPGHVDEVDSEEELLDEEEQAEAATRLLSKKSSSPATASFSSSTDQHLGARRLSETSTITMAYDFSCELQVLLTLTPADVSPAEFVGHPSFVQTVQQAFSDASAELGVSPAVPPTDLTVQAFADSGGFGVQEIYDPLTGQMVSVSQADMAAGKMKIPGMPPGLGGMPPPANPGGNPNKPRELTSASPEHTIRLVIDLQRHASGRALALAAQKREKFLDTYFKPALATHPRIAEIKDLAYTPAGFPSFNENNDQTPAKADFTTLSEFQAVQAEKPWCDWSTATGSPGVGPDGVEYRGRTSIFCDGLHDGLLVVNAAGFSNEQLVPPNSNMRLLVRGSANDASSTAPMEVRKIKKAYQWLFPSIDPTTGTLGDDRVTPWICQPEQWADGICDCNCGRPDWDCMGDRGIPQLYVEERLDDPTSTVSVNINCPKGNNVVVKVPELPEGELPPTCGQIKAQPAKYGYCDFATGLPTSVRENMYQSASFNGTRLQAPTYMRYLWEVIELDCPLVTDRPVGTLVETLGVSEVTAAAFQSASLATASAYVDTSLMQESVEEQEGDRETQAGGGIDQACLVDNPPPFCGGGKITTASGAIVHTSPVIKTALGMKMKLPAGTTGAQLMQDPEFVPAFQSSLAATMGIPPHQVTVTGINVVPARQRRSLDEEEQKSVAGSHLLHAAPTSEKIFEINDPSSAQRQLSGSMEMKVEFIMEVVQDSQEDAEEMAKKMTKAMTNNPDEVQKRLKKGFDKVETIKVSLLEMGKLKEPEVEMPRPQVGALMPAGGYNNMPLPFPGVADPQMPGTDYKDDPANLYPDYSDPNAMKPGYDYADPTQRPVRPAAGTDREPESPAANPDAGKPDPNPSPAGPDAGKPNPNPSPAGPDAGKPDPTPAPAGPDAGKPDPTPAPDAGKPDPTPAPAGPDPTPAPAGGGAGAANFYMAVKATYQWRLRGGAAQPANVAIVTIRQTQLFKAAMLRPFQNWAEITESQIDDLQYQDDGGTPPDNEKIILITFRFRPDEDNSTPAANRLMQKLEDERGNIAQATIQRVQQWADTRDGTSIPQWKVELKELDTGTPPEYVKEKIDLRRQLAQPPAAQMRRKDEKKSVNTIDIEAVNPAGLVVQELIEQATPRRLTSTEKRDLHSRMVEKFPWMAAEFTKVDLKTSGPDSSQLTETSSDALVLAESLYQRVYSSTEYQQLYRRNRRLRGTLNGADEDVYAALHYNEVPDYETSRARTRAEVLALRREQANRGNERLRLLDDEVSEEISSSGDHVDRNNRELSLRKRRELEIKMLQREYRSMLLDPASEELQLARDKNSMIFSNDEAGGHQSGAGAEEEARSTNTKWVPTMVGDEQVYFPYLLTEDEVLDENADGPKNLRSLTASAANLTLCPVAANWTDSTQWPPNAVIGMVPVCARAFLNEAQLEELGFYDFASQGGTKSALNLEDALSLFASSTSSSQTDKKVISFVVQSISKVNLFRDPSSVYLPKNRHGSTTTETYRSPESLDAHMAVFVMPKRTPYADLCPSQAIDGEFLTNAFANSPGRGIFKQFWGKWGITLEDNFSVQNCTVKQFSDTQAFQHCKSQAELRTDSRDKYRMFCSKDFLPGHHMLFEIAGPLTGQWLLPKERADESYSATLPEWNVDLEATYYLTFDKKFLEVEKEYMAEGGDYVNNEPRLWAAEPLARGRAICTNKIRGCAQGIPANPPMLLPGVRINVNHKRTKALLEQIEPKYWPAHDSGEKLESLLAQLDNLNLDLHSGLRTLGSAEDGFIAIKPMSIVQINLVWQVNPIYVVDKWQGGIVLDRWATSISSLDINYADADYTMRSSCSVRLLFQIDPGSQRFQEIPILELKNFLAFVGAYIGYIGMVAAFLTMWQKLTKPFGVVDAYYVDTEYENVVGRWYIRQMKMLGFDPPPDAEDESPPAKDDAAGARLSRAQQIIPQPLPEPGREWTPRPGVGKTIKGGEPTKDGSVVELTIIDEDLLHMKLCDEDGAESTDEPSSGAARDTDSKTGDLRDAAEAEGAPPAQQAPLPLTFKRGMTVTKFTEEQDGEPARPKRGFTVTRLDEEPTEGDIKPAAAPPTGSAAAVVVEVPPPQDNPQPPAVVTLTSAVVEPLDEQTVTLL